MKKLACWTINYYFLKQSSARSSVNLVDETNSGNGITVNENNNSIRSSNAGDQANDGRVERSSDVNRSSAVEVASEIVSNAILGAFDEIEWSHQSNLEQEIS